MKFIENQTVGIAPEVFLMPEMFDLMLGRIFLCHEAVILLFTNNFVTNIKFRLE